ncbi:MAG: tetratricopeptide repeat protein, partial [Bdellovibrionales bacterium]|nr:tetratricopeptide repeat protein [Bdellovibrionales bacterium]
AEKELLSLQESDDSETINLLLAGIYTVLNKSDEATLNYKKVLSNNPGNEEACVFLSKLYSQNQQIKKAYKLLNKCEKKNKGQGIFSYFKGKISVNQNDKVSAKKFFKQSLKVDPSYYQSVLAIGFLSEEKEKFEDAAKVYKNFLEKNPDHFIVLSRFVQVLFVLQKYEEVLGYAERLSLLDPEDISLKVKLGVLYTDAARYKEAKKIFEHVLEKHPDSEKVLYYLGALNQQTGFFDQSIEYYMKIKPVSSLFHDSNLQISKMLQVQALTGDQEKINDYFSFIKRRSNEFSQLKVGFKLSLANYYELTERNDLAISELLSVQHDQDFKIAHIFYLASLYEKSKIFSKSIPLVKAILDKDPENAQALNFIGYSLLDRGIELDKAFNYISKAVKLSPKDGYIRDSLGWYYYKVGKLKKAKQEIEKALETAKGDVVIIKHLAIVYQELKNYAKAKEYLVEALKHCDIESEKRSVLDAMQSLEAVRLPASGVPEKTTP